MTASTRQAAAANHAKRPVAAACRSAVREWIEVTLLVACRQFPSRL